MMGRSPQCYKASHKVIGPLVLEEKIFEGFLPYMGVAAILVRHGCHLGHMIQTPQTNFHSPIPLRLHMKFGFDRSSKPQGQATRSLALWFWRRRFLKGFYHIRAWLPSWSGVAAILVIWPRPHKQSFVPPSHWGSIWNLALIGQVVLEKKIMGRGTEDGRTTNQGYTISSSMSLKAQVS